MTEQDLQLLHDGFEQRSVQRGLDLHRRGAVVWLEHDAGESLINAQVQGTQRTPYYVTVFIAEFDEVIEGACSCPVGFNCKHAVAAFLSYRSVIDSSNGSAIAPGGQPDRHFSESKSSPANSDLAGAAVDQWLKRFAAAGASRLVNPPAEVTGQDQKTNPRQRLYVLEPLSARSTTGEERPEGVRLFIREANRTRAGHFNKGRQYEPGQWYARHDLLIEHVDEEIAACGAALASQAHGGSWFNDTGQYTLVGRVGTTLLQLAVESQRAFVGQERHRPLEQGPAREPHLLWQESDQGERSLHVQLADLEHWYVIATDPPMYLDPHAHQIGFLDTDMTGEQVLLALGMPSVPESHLQTFGEALETLEQRRPGLLNGARPATGTAPFLIPLPVPLEERISEAPVPMLFLYSLDNEAHVDSWMLTVIARYGDALVTCSPMHDASPNRGTLTDGTSVRVLRDKDIEKRWFYDIMERYPELALHSRITEEPEEQGADDHEFGFQANAADAAGRFRVYRQIVTSRVSLERDGWRLIVMPPVHTEAERPRRFEAMINVDEGVPGWFDLALGFEHNGRRYDLVLLVMTWLERGGGDQPLLVEQEDGRFIEVPADSLKPVAAVMAELGQQQGGSTTIRLSRARALALKTLQDDLGDAGVDTDWQGHRPLLDFTRHLHALSQVDTSDFADTPVPRALKATLRPYQRAGLGWLNTLATHDLCGILADDMGLGKTIQTLAHLLWLRSARRINGPALVIAPTSLLSNWAREASQFAPRLKIRIWHGANRHDAPLLDEAVPVDLVITSYGLALRDRDLLAERGFGLLVLDEAQHIRNPAAKITRAVKSLPVPRKVCLSGTPLENHLGELWSLFDFLMPGVLGDAKRFTRHYRTPIERHGNTERQHRLAAAVRPFILRRRKEDVATELPPRSDFVREVSLAGAQAKLYESIRVTMQKRVRAALQQRGVAQSQITVLDSLLKLRQLCCHPELVKLPSARAVKESAKTTVVLDMIEEMINEGRRILVFSQFTSMLSILERELAERQLSWVKLTGQTRKRDAAIDRFQSGEVPLFLISLKAGGTGLNLTAADTVIHYDPWWNPAAEEQASARAHRIGQTKPVFVYRMVTTGTVEERIIELQARKRALAESMLERGNAGALTSLSADETLSLFDAL